jgi:phospholipid transport system substrate-binding protein
MKKISLFLLLVLAPMHSYGESSLTKDASAALHAMHKLAASTLTGTGISDAERQARFRSLLHKWFDLNKIGRFTLGRYWRTASKSEQASYQKYFEDYLVVSYADSFKSYTGKNFKVTKVSSRPKTNVAIVSTEIVVKHNGSSKPVKVDWRLKRRSNGQFKITDISVENVSMSITRRKEFASIIHRAGGKVGAIITELHKKSRSVRLS